MVQPVPGRCRTAGLARASVAPCLAVLLAGPVNPSRSLAADQVAAAGQRSNPAVEVPVEFRTAVVRAPVWSYMFADDGQKILVVHPGIKKRHEYIDVNELEKAKNVRPAVHALPVRMVMIAASFPYRRQLEVVEQALGFENLEVAAREVRLCGLHVQRREVGPDGARKPWDEKEHDIPVERDFRTLSALCGKTFEAEDQALRPVLVPGLAMRRPKLLGAHRYPAVERVLPKLTVAQEALAGGGPKRPVPEYVLLRLLDVTPMMPGKTYEYRLRVRMKNPNFQKEKGMVDPAQAAAEEIVSDWAVVPQTVTVPHDFYFYAVDTKRFDPRAFAGEPEPGQGQVAVQLHRWVEDMSPPETRRPLPVGEWAVVPRVLANVGEFIGGRWLVEVPVWDYVEHDCILASWRFGAPEERGRVQVDFTPEGAPLLVQVEAGEVRSGRYRDEAPTELLVLSPNGRLLLRRATDDLADAERVRRYKAWKEQVAAIKARTRH